MAWYDQVTDKFVANVANKYMQEINWEAFDIFPKVNSKQKSGFVAKYEKEDWLRVGDVKEYVRTGATESKGDTFASGKQSYVLEEYAFHEDVSKEDREEYDNPFDPIKDATEFVVNRLRLVAAKKFGEVFGTGIWGSDVNIGTSSSKWNDSSSDPISDVLTYSQAVESFTGFWPNRIAMTRDVFAALKTNAAIKSVMKTTSDKIVTTGLLAKVFEVEKVVVFSAVETTAKKGATATTANTNYMVSNRLLLCYAPNRASKKAPSAGYHITYKGSNGNIVTKKIPNRLANDAVRIEGSLYTKPMVMAPDLGVLFTNIV